MKKHGHKHSGEHHMHHSSGMSHKGHEQGDMKPTVNDIQRPADSFSQHGLGTTLEYISRHNAQDKHDDHQITKQAYKGRYS